MTTMTTVDPYRTFREALPKGIPAQLRDTQAAVALVHAAIRDHGWTPEQLAHEASKNLAGVENVGGAITARLRQFAQTDPPQSSVGPGLHRAHFGCCESGWLYDETTDPPRVTKCPGSGGGDPA